MGGGGHGERLRGESDPQEHHRKFEEKVFQAESHLKDGDRSKKHSRRKEYRENRKENKFHYKRNKHDKQDDYHFQAEFDYKFNH